MMKKTPSTKYLKLPLLFEKSELVTDLQSITSEWKAHHYTHNYEGGWNSIALYSKDGKEDSISVHDQSSENLKETEALSNAPYIREVINHFKFPLISVRLLKLTSGSIIKPHKDYQLGYENNNFRLHIPILTNDLVEFVLDGNKLKMLPGECWYTNVNFTHSVANRSNEDRIHLVIDGERNTWSDDLFFSLAPKESFAVQEELSKEVLKMMIEELKNQTEPASKELLAEYERKLSNC